MIYGINPQTDPLESYAECHFNLPARYTYYVKGTKETFKSLETDHKKAYQKHLETKLNYENNSVNCKISSFTKHLC
jgi:hypothetical protein